MASRITVVPATGEKTIRSTAIPKFTAFMGQIGTYGYALYIKTYQTLWMVGSDAMWDQSVDLDVFRYRPVNIRIEVLGDADRG